jgi:NADH dehydrogenase
MPHVVVIGAGFGGLTCVQALVRSPVRITLIDRRNYHLFQPLLYQVATAALSPAEIAWPIRSILRSQENVDVQLGNVTGVDKAARKVLLEDGRSMPYDYLVIATGVRHAYFGHDDWATYAPGLKKIADATLIRERILTAFEEAEVEVDPARRQALLTFVVIGGGPTGVEMAGAIAELVRYALAEDFRRIHPRDAKVILLEGGKRLLPAFPEEMSEKTLHSLKRLGVQVMLEHQVTCCDAEGVIAGGQRISSSSVVWAAGVQASPAAIWLDTPADKAGRVVVEPDLAIPGHPEIYVIGDTASVQYDGGPVPGIAPAAKQMGSFVGKRIRALVSGDEAASAFRYRHAGNLATIGRGAAVVDFGWIKLSGFIAWVVWGIAHIYFLISWRNRFTVALNWLWEFVTFQRGARLITGAPQLDDAIAEHERQQI